jgi:transposase-like protein
VARQNDNSPQHLFAWRKAARASLLSLPADKGPLFVPVVTERRAVSKPPSSVTPKSSRQTSAVRRPLSNVQSKELTKPSEITRVPP